MPNFVQDQKNIFRLSTLIYNGDNYNIKNENIIKKIIESIFIDKNEFMEVPEVINFCEEKYGLNIIEESIEKIVLNNPKSFIIQFKSDTEFIFKLVEKRYKAISDYKSLGIEEYVNLFIDSTNREDKENVKELIYKFLYEIFTSNLNSYEYFLHNKAIDRNFSVDSSKYTDEEIQLINDFLSYNNPEKDKAIFSIVSLSLEYCLLTGNGNQIYIQGLNNKVFYLDTNVLYRAIGINGIERKESTLKFIKKCVDINIGVKISKYTEEEFEKSLNYYISQFRKYNGSCSNPQLYEKYSKGRDLYNSYCEWRCGKENNDLEIFKAHIKSQYEKFKKDHKVVSDYKNVLNDKDKELIKLITEISSSIGMYKPSSHTSSDEIDAKNFILIKDMREKTKQSNKKLLETKYFLISTDQKLREWNYSALPNELPVVFLPSQWLGIILRFVSATNDDYKSFVSFLNIKKNESIIPSDKLQAVLSGIAEITNEIQTQEFFAKEIVENKVIDIISLEDNYEVFEEVSKYVKESMDEEVATYQRELALEKEDKKSLLKKQQNLNNRLIEERVNTNLNKWRKNSIIFIALTVLIVFYLALHICLENYWFNFVTKIYNWIGQNESKKWVVQSIDGFVCFTLLIYSLNEIYSRLNKKSKKYKEKHNEFIIEAESYIKGLE